MHYEIFKILCLPARFQVFGPPLFYQRGLSPRNNSHSDFKTGWEFIPGTSGRAQLSPWRTSIRPSRDFQVISHIRNRSWMWGKNSGHFRAICVFDRYISLDVVAVGEIKLGHFRQFPHERGGRFRHTTEVLHNTNTKALEPREKPLRPTPGIPGASLSGGNSSFDGSLSKKWVELSFGQVKLSENIQSRFLFAKNPAYGPNATSVPVTDAKVTNTATCEETTIPPPKVEGAPSTDNGSVIAGDGTIPASCHGGIARTPSSVPRLLWGT
ncbi:hypothetical protein RUND412_004666 [Rhizina undulata]